MIKVKNLSKSYLTKGKSRTIFKNLNFTINTGESVALLGRNGAGKSTLLNIIGGVDQPDSGEVIRKCSVSWPLGLVGGFQGSLSARENVMFVSKLMYGNKRILIKKTVDFVRDFAEIGNYFDLPFNTYSSGMRLRVTFGLSMAFHFDFYLVDEITSVGDEKFRKKCNELLVNKVAQSSFIMVNHNLSSLKKYCDKAIVLHNGNALMYSSLSEAIKMHKYLLFE